MDATETSHLTALPAEILHNILQWIYPADLVVLPRVCRLLYEYVKGNQTLYRAVYLETLVRLSSLFHCEPARLMAMAGHAG